jgi:hypothetical protein
LLSGKFCEGSSYPGFLEYYSVNGGQNIDPQWGNTNLKDQSWM